MLSKALTTAAAGSSAPTDENFNQTVLLLHGDGTNGAQNNTFLDSSTNNFTITRNGNTTQGTFSPFSLPNGKWSNYFNGSSYFTSSTALFNYTTANAATQTFTIEAWVYHTTRATPTASFYSQSIAAKGDVYLNFGINGSGNLVFYHYDGSQRILTGSSVIPLNTWTHVAVVVSGGTATIYVNAVSDVSGTWYGIEAGGLSLSSYFGRPATNASALYFQGYVSNLRVSSTARSITVPTSPYTNDGNTVFLTEQSNRFVDNSSNEYALAVVGTPSVQPFSPFAPSAAYSASVNGGSGYFDGSGDYLAITDSSAFTFAGDFSISFWLYRTATSASSINVLDARPSGSATGYGIGILSNNKLQLFQSGSSILESTTALALNQWYYAQIVKSGATTTMYINGVSEDSDGSFSPASSTGIHIGQKRYTSSGYVDYPGYLFGFSIVNGTAISSSVPTAPPTAIANTSLLLNFTNAGIFDNTGKNNLETVGNAQIDTTTKKYGTGSMEFDGTGDWLIGPTTVNCDFGTGDFTIEGWIYPTATTGADRCLWDTRASAGDSGMVLFIDSSTAALSIYSSNAIRITSTSAVTINVFQHIALVRSSGTLAFYINGTQVGTNSYASAITCPGRVYIGVRFDLQVPYSGFIDDLRITKGVARYTANFTPPTEAFPNL